ncbi:MAG TPA: magnesium/cobalt transporter CorA [Treponemataceae bacterium]|nr:magnesium/cobalt transporter CorA [Treponemataceae bacterium]
MGKTNKPHRAEHARRIQPLYRNVGESGAGVSPGTPVYIGDREPAESTYTLIQYTPRSVTVATPKTVEELMAMIEPDAINWINVNGLASEADYKWLCALFKLDPLTMEDMRNTEHRPKFEDFGEYIMLITKMLKRHELGATEYEQVSFVLTKNTVITFQEVSGDCFDPVRERLKSGAGRIRRLGIDYLAYALLDVIVDNYFAVLEDIGRRLEHFEDESTQDRESTRFMAGLQNVKRELNTMRRILWPVRDVVNAALHSESALITDELRPFLRDLLENCVQVIEAIENYRETASGIQEVFLSTVSLRMNEVMKMLTVISTIFIPLTFIAGVYGMNFMHMPELGSRWGYPAAWLVMAAIASALILYFKKKKWL